MWKIWPTNYSMHATSNRSASFGLTTLYGVKQSYERVFLGETTIQRARCEDSKAVNERFALVRNTKAKYGILDEDTYNFDETGFMMGVIFPGMVVTTSEGRGKAKLAQPGNREWATVIQAVCAGGWAVPPFIILAAQYHLANWYQECDLPSTWRIATTDNGWTTNKVGLDWIKHFNHHTKHRTKGTYRLLILDGHERSPLNGI